MNAKTLLLGTRKGLLILERGDSGWTLKQEAHSGIPVSFAMRDRRTGTIWAGLEHGHWGSKLQRSRDGGATWEGVPAPAYPEGAEVKPGKPATLEYIWFIGEGGESKRDRLYIGTNPGGLFRSDDGGESWALVQSLWDHPSRPENWFGGGRDTPGIHSVIVDPRNEERVLVGISCAGVFETTDDGATWTPRNQGLEADFLPDPTSDVGHDPHYVALCPANPDVIWQQNHVGIFRSTDGAKSWSSISQEGGPAHFGFAIAAHAHEPDTAWVVPAISDMQRMAIGGGLMVCRTDDGGKTWIQQRKGLPQKMSYDVVYRHALDLQGDALAFGSTTGNVYFSDDGGESWECVGNHLPPIYSVRFA